MGTGAVCRVGADSRRCGCRCGRDSVPPRGSFQVKMRLVRLKPDPTVIRTTVMRTHRVVTSCLISVAVAGVCFCSLAPVGAEQASDLGLRIARLLDPIRRNYNLPAVGGAIVTSKGLIGVGVTGVRKAGTDVLATTDDRWHLGSDTKAMTATMIGLLVQQGKLRWDSTIGEVFTDLASGSRSPLTKATLLQLLSHRAGVPANLSGGWDKIPRNLPIRRQREMAVETALKVNNAK